MALVLVLQTMMPMSLKKNYLKQSLYHDNPRHWNMLVKRANETRF